MPDKTRKTDLFQEKLLERNQNVSKLVVAQYKELAKQLEALGVRTKPRYTLSPPLGGTLSNALKNDTKLLS